MLILVRLSCLVAMLYVCAAPAHQPGLSAVWLERGVDRVVAHVRLNADEASRALRGARASPGVPGSDEVSVRAAAAFLALTHEGAALPVVRAEIRRGDDADSVALSIDYALAGRGPVTVALEPRGLDAMTRGHRQLVYVGAPPQPAAASAAEAASPGPAGSSAARDPGGPRGTAAAVLPPPVAILSRSDAAARIDLPAAGATPPSTDTSHTSLAPGPGWFADGVLHILGGVDHLAFVLLLVLPLVGGSSGSARTSQAGALRLVQLITAFSLAHSLTLLLGATGIVSLSPRLVEGGIALSVVVAALMNAGEDPRSFAPPIAFAFGLLHGLGFAGAVTDMGLGGGSDLSALVWFNLGIEGGQLALLAGLLVAAAAWKRTPFSLSRILGEPRAGARLVSIGIAVMGTAWLAERLV